MKKRTRVSATRDGFIATKNKKMHNWTMYCTTVGLLTLNIVSKNHAGYITHYDLYFADKHFVGNNQEDLIQMIKNLYLLLGLRKMTENSKEVVVVYVDKLDKIRGFCSKYISEDSGKMVELFNHVEFREWSDWIAEESLEDIQEIVNKIFVPEKYFYLTPNQRTRKLLLKECDDDTYLEVYPEDYIDYKSLRKALFGGICYVKCPGLTIEHNMICLDIKSAYIFSLLIEKHCISKREEVNTDYWEYFLDAEDESSFGLYEIKYSTASTIVSCYKDCDGNNFKKGEQIVKVWMNSIDLSLFMNLPNVYVHNINCLYLEKYRMNYLPYYVRKHLLTEFIKKSEISEDDNPVLYKLQKIVLNGIYGNTIKRVDCKDDFFALRKTNALAPQWGIWTTSYTKKLLLGLATQLQGWYYSDTDSIYCLDTYENSKKIYEYNKMIQDRILDFCRGDEQLFSFIKNLGNFELKHHILKFKAIKQKEYIFTDFSKKVHLKAAGCNKREIPEDDNLYNLDKFPVGTRIFPKINPEKTTEVINGITYTSDGSYWEYTCSGQEAEFELWQIAMINDMK